MDPGDRVDKALPLNALALDVLGTFWAGWVQEGRSQVLVNALTELTSRDDQRRGHAFQIVLIFFIATRTSHKHERISLSRATPHHGPAEEFLLLCDKHYLAMWERDVLPHGLREAPTSSVTWFTGKGPPGFDIVFQRELEGGSTSYLFVDATVSRLKHKLPPPYAENARSEVILDAIANAVHVPEGAVVLSDDCMEILVLDEDKPLSGGRFGFRDDVDITFAVATAHPKPQVRKANVGWIRFLDLDALVACGWIPVEQRDKVAAANARS